MLISTFLDRVDDYCARSGRLEGGISDALFGNGAKLRHLRAGKTVTVRALERAHGRLDRLFAELDAEAAMRAGVGGQADHAATVAEAGPDRDCNAALRLQRGLV